MQVFQCCRTCTSRITDWTTGRAGDYLRTEAVLPQAPEESMVSNSTNSSTEQEQTHQQKAFWCCTGLLNSRRTRKWRVSPAVHDEVKVGEGALKAPSMCMQHATQREVRAFAKDVTMSRGRSGFSRHCYSRLAAEGCHLPMQLWRC